MRYLVPGYYADFHCIADKCRHSCCIGWNVYVDERAENLWHTLTTSLLAKICSCLRRDEDGVYVEMREDGRCPMLDERGLCRLISEQGDGALPLICRRHPRFINYVGDACIVGLGICCEEACRIVLLDDKPFSLVEYEKMPFEWGDIPDMRENEPYGTQIALQAIAAIDSAATLTEAEKLMYSGFGVQPIGGTAMGWAARLRDLEMLDPTWANILSGSPEGIAHFSFQKRELVLKNLLSYFVLRYATEAEDSAQLQLSLRLALLLTRIVDALFDKNRTASVADALDICRAFSAEIEYSDENLEALRFDLECDF